MRKQWYICVNKNVRKSAKHNPRIRHLRQLGDDREDDVGFLASATLRRGGERFGRSENRCDANGCNPCHDQSGLISLAPSSFSSRTLSSSHLRFPSLLSPSQQRSRQSLDVSAARRFHAFDSRFVIENESVVMEERRHAGTIDPSAAGSFINLHHLSKISTFVLKTRLASSPRWGVGTMHTTMFTMAFFIAAAKGPIDFPSSGRPERRSDTRQTVREC